MTGELEMWTEQKAAELRLIQLNSWLRDEHSVNPDFPVEVTTVGDTVHIHDVQGGFDYVLNPRSANGDTIFDLETDPIGEIKNPKVVAMIEKSGFKLRKWRTRQLRGSDGHSLEVGEEFFVEVGCGLGSVKKNYDFHFVEESSVQAGHPASPEFSHVYFRAKSIGLTEITLSTPQGDHQFKIEIIEPRAEAANRRQKAEVVLLQLERKFPNQMQSALWQDRKEAMLQWMTSQEMRKLLNSLSGDNEYQSCMNKVTAAISDARQQRRYDSR